MMLGVLGLVLMRIDPESVLLDTAFAAIGGALAVGFLPWTFAYTRSRVRWLASGVLLLALISEYSTHVPNLSGIWHAPGLIELYLAIMLCVHSASIRMARAKYLLRSVRVLAVVFFVLAAGQLGIWVVSTYPEPPRNSGTQLGILVITYTALAAVIHRVHHIEHLPVGRCPVCSYSLAGLEGDICPECGTPISPSINRTPSPAAVAIPLSTRFRPAVYRAGLALIAGGAVLLQAPGNSLERLKPGFILRRDARMTETYELTTPAFTPRATAAGWTLSKDHVRISTPPATQAIKELIRRARHRTLGRQLANALIHDTLDIQLHYDRAMGKWPELFHELDAIGYVSNEDRRTFFEQSIVLALVTRPRVQAGRPLPYDIIGMIRGYDGPRRTNKPWLPTSEQLADAGIIHINAATIDGRPIDEPTTIVEHLPTRGSIFGFAGLNGVDRTMPKAPAEPGEHTILLDVSIGFIPQQGSGGDVLRREWARLGLPLTIGRTLAHTFQVVQEPTVAIDDISDSEFHIRAQNTNLAFVGRDENAPPDHRTKFQVSPRNYYVSIGRRQAPSPVLTRAFISADGNEVEIGWAYFEQRGAVGWQSLSMDDAAYDALRKIAAPQAWRFIFRSDPSMAERTTSLERVSTCRDIVIPARYLGSTHEHGSSSAGGP